MWSNPVLATAIGMAIGGVLLNNITDSNITDKNNLNSKSSETDKDKQIDE